MNLLMKGLTQVLASDEEREIWTHAQKKILRPAEPPIQDFTLTPQD